jgi:hypothetical protein
MGGSEPDESNSPLVAAILLSWAIGVWYLAGFCFVVLPCGAAPRRLSGAHRSPRLSQACLYRHWCLSELRRSGRADAQSRF